VDTPEFNDAPDAPDTSLASQPEQQQGKLPSEDRLRAYLDQVLLRIWNASPGLSCYKESDRIVPERGTIEVSFFKLPEEILSGVSEVFGVKDVETLAYTKKGKACIGFRVKPSEEDLSALAVDDSADHDAIQPPTKPEADFQSENPDDVLPLP